MIFAVLALGITAYSVAASWASPMGPGRLWVTAILGLGLVIAGTLALGALYAVPDTSRLLLYSVVLTGPAILLATLGLGHYGTTRPDFGAAATPGPRRRPGGARVWRWYHCVRARRLVNQDIRGERLSADSSSSEMSPMSRRGPQVRYCAERRRK